MSDGIMPLASCLSFLALGSLSNGVLGNGLGWKMFLAPGRMAPQAVSRASAGRAGARFHARPLAGACATVRHCRRTVDRA
jgi:hypothetical protein